MFYVPSEDVPSKPNWTRQPLFLTDGRKPLLVAHVIPASLETPSAGCWAFAHPSDFEHLLNGIAQNEEPYKITSLCVLLNPGMCIESIIAEEVIEITSNSIDSEFRSFLVRTILGNAYLLGDELKRPTTFDLVIYQRGESGFIVPGGIH